MKKIDKIRLRMVNQLFTEKFPVIPGILIRFISLIYFYIMIKDIFLYNFILSKFYIKQTKFNLDGDTKVLYVDHKIDHYELTKLHHKIYQAEVITFNKIFFVFEKTYPYFIVNHLNSNIKILHIGTIEFLSLFNVQFIAKKCKNENIFLMVTYHSFGDHEENIEMLRYCDLIIVLSDKVKEELGSIGFQNVIVNYLPSSYSNIESPKKENSIRKLNLNPNKIILSLIGSIREDKGYEFFLKSVKKLDDIYKDRIFLNFAGKVVDRTYKNISELLPECGIEYRLCASEEFLTDEEFIENIVASDALVIPYTRDTTNASGPMMEGAYRKVPIIGTDNGDIGYTINKWKIGFTFKHKNSDDLSNVLIKFIDNHSKSDVNFDEFINDHSEAKFAAKHSVIYREILNNNFNINKHK